MTVKELKEKLNEFPDDTVIMVNSDELYNHCTTQVSIELNDMYESKNKNLYYFDKSFAVNDEPIKAVLINEIIS